MTSQELVLLLLFVCVKRSEAAHKIFGPNVSLTLDNLLAGGKYDKKIRPSIGGAPVLVTVNMHIKSIGPVSETQQSYTMDVYFRQSWYDNRLSFSLPGLEEFSMSWLFLNKVWKPDTYFINGKKSQLHRITSPNKFLRLRHDGFIIYSMRLTISASCKMYLKKFPMDSQLCPLLIGSYGYTSSDLLYQWHSEGTPVGLEPGIEIAQYDLANITTYNKKTVIRGNEEFSMIQANFMLRRSLGYFILQMYVPCTLIVCCSWVSFWINPDDVPARVYLAVMTVLSITTMGFGGRSALPKVNYATALDWFVIVCFAFVFAVIVEYTVINFIDKVTKDIKRLLEEREKNKSEPTDEKEFEDTEEELQADEKETERHEAEEEITIQIPPFDSIPKILMTCEIDSFDGNGGEVEDKKYDEHERNDNMTMEYLKIPIAEAQIKVRRSYSVPALCAAHNNIFDKYKLDNRTIKLYEDVSEDVIQVAEEPGTDRTRISLRSTLLIPVRLWKQLRIVPNEEDVAARTEPPDKFTRIDINSRILFPVAFVVVICFYVLLYSFYMEDVIFEDISLVI